MFTFAFPFSRTDRRSRGPQQGDHLGGILTLFVFIAALYKWHRRQAAIVARLAEQEKHREWDLAMCNLWDKVEELRCALTGTTFAEWGETWKKLNLLNKDIATAEVPQSQEPFWVESTAISRLLKHLNNSKQIGRVENEYLDFVNQWIDDLAERFRKFALRNEGKRRFNDSMLLLLQRQHRKTGEAFTQARCNSVFQHFPGMLHMVEVLIDDGAPSEQVAAYLAALSNQLVNLQVSFDLSPS